MFDTPKPDAVKKKFSYFLHGLTVHSEIEFPELLPHFGGVPDVQIRFGTLDHIPPDKERPWRNRALSSNQALLNVKDVAKILVSDGKDIMIDPYPNADAKAIRLYLLGSSMGCLLHQRHLLPLHANALQYGNECLMFVGHSGTGKSTLAAAMKNMGYKVLADDVCAVKTSSGSKSVIYPGIPQIKLWKDAADYLEEDVALMRRIQPDEEKYALPLDGDYCRQSLQIKCIYILDFHVGNTLKIADLTLLEKLKAIKSYTYRKGMVAKMGIAENHLKMSGELVEATRIRRILRPQNSLKRINELIEAIEGDMP